MNDLENIFKTIKEAPDENKIGLVGVLINIVARTPKMPLDEKMRIKDFAMEQIKGILSALQNEAFFSLPYREKDKVFCYNASLTKLFFVAAGDPKNIKPSENEIIETAEEIIKKETVVENAVNKMFAHDVIVRSDVDCLLDVIKTVDDPYRIGVFYSGVFHYRKKLAKAEPDAKAELEKFIIAQTDEMLNHPLEGDEITTLEVVADILSDFPTKNSVALLNRILKTNYNRARFYAVDSLLTLKSYVDRSVIEELAKDVTVASLVYGTLIEHNSLGLLPAEYADEEYLAKSDMVQWLMYPTELNKQPDKIEHLGATKIKREKIHIFKFMSDSDTLSDDCKNVWLIGWSGNGGSTFSQFDKLSDYEQSTPKKTLKNIIRKLLK